MILAPGRRLVRPRPLPLLHQLEERRALPQTANQPPDRLQPRQSPRPASRGLAPCLPARTLLLPRLPLPLTHLRQRHFQSVPPPRFLRSLPRAAPRPLQSPQRPPPERIRPLRPPGHQPDRSWKFLGQCRAQARRPPVLRQPRPLSMPHSPAARRMISRTTSRWSERLQPRHSPRSVVRPLPPNSHRS